MSDYQHELHKHDASPGNEWPLDHLDMSAMGTSDDDVDETASSPWLGASTDDGFVYHGVDPSNNDSFGEHLVFAEEGKQNLLRGSDDRDNLEGADADDVLVGASGDDQLSGNEGNDILYGGLGSDHMDGGKGQDVLSGGEGDDVIEGGSGSDILTGGEGNDILQGSFGSDILTGGPGNDTLSGEQGNDFYRFDKGDGQDVILNASPHRLEGYLPSDIDRIEYGNGIRADQLWLQRIGGDLKLTDIETGDSQTIQHWYEGDAYRVDCFALADGSFLSGDKVAPLVEAMAGMTMPAIGSSHLTGALQSALHPVLAQSWQ